MLTYSEKDWTYILSKKSLYATFHELAVKSGSKEVAFMALIAKLIEWKFFN